MVGVVGVVKVECLGGKKAKHSTLVIHHDTINFTIPLGALAGNCRLELNAKGRTGWSMYKYINQTESCPFQNCSAQTEWSSLSCFITCLPSNMNDGGTNNDDFFL